MPDEKKRDTKRSPKPHPPTDVHEPSPVRRADKPVPDEPPPADEARGKRSGNGDDAATGSRGGGAVNE